MTEKVTELWYILPKLPGYEVRGDGRSVRSVTRRIWVFRPKFKDICLDWIKKRIKDGNPSLLEVYAFPRIVKGRTLKRTRVKRHGKDEVGYIIFGNFYTVERLLDIALGFSEIEIPKRAPLLTETFLNEPSKNTGDWI